MKYEYHYRHVDSSEALTQYTEGCLEKAGRYLLKEGRCQIYFNMGRYDYNVEITVFTGQGQFKATASSIESFYIAVDEAVDKLEKQYLKTKKKSQYHKNPRKSKQGRYEHLNEQLEYQYGDDYFEKVS